MKKVLNSLAVIALVGFMATGCNSNDNSKNTTVTKKILPAVNFPGTVKTFTDTVPVFEKKTYKGTVCETGKQYTGTTWKPAGERVISHTYTEEGDAVPTDSLNSWAGNTIVNKDCPGNSSRSGGISNGSSDIPDWLANIWYVVLAILLLAVLGWFLWWLFNQRPQRNNISSNSKPGSMQNSAANPTRVAELTAMVAALKGQNGEGKGMIKDAKENFEVVVGEVKNTPSIWVKNTGNNVNFYFGNATLTNSGSSYGVEPKKEEPAASVAQP